MMKKPILFFVFFILISFTAIAWTPNSDGDFRNYYALRNVTNFTAQLILQNGSELINAEDEPDLNVNSSNYWDNLDTSGDIRISDLDQVGEVNLSVNTSEYWDNLDTPGDIRISDLDQAGEVNLSVNTSEYWDALDTPGDIRISDLDQSGEINLSVNTSEYWDNLDTPGDIRISDLDQSGEINLSVNQSSFWATVSSFSARWFYNLANVFTFNETRMNATIDEKIAETSETYLPATVSVINGTLDNGNLSSLFTIDGDTLNVSETTGVPGMDIRINFTSVVSFNQISLYQYYNGSLAHTIQLELWNYLTQGWDTFAIFSDQGGFISITGFVPDDDNYINTTDDNRVQLRIDHDDSGDASHDIFIDLAILQLSGTGGATVGGSGTVGLLPLWIGIQSLGDSIISQLGTTVTVTGNLNATTEICIKDGNCVSTNQPGTLTNITGTAPIVSDGASPIPTISLTLLKDIVTTAPLSGGENDVLPGADADLTLSIAACANNEIIQYNSTSGAWECAISSAGGTITEIIAGDGLSGGTITTNGTIAIDAITTGAGNYSYWSGSAWLTRADVDTTYSAGNGIALSTTTFSVAGNVALTQDADGLSVTNDSIGDQQLAFNTGQALTTASGVTFATVDTGQGANELYDMDQNVLEASVVTFANVTQTYNCMDASCTVYRYWNGSCLIDHTPSGESRQGSGC